MDLCREYRTYSGHICDVKPAISVIIFRRIIQYIYVNRTGYLRECLNWNHPIEEYGPLRGNYRNFCVIRITAKYECMFSVM